MRHVSVLLRRLRRRETVARHAELVAAGCLPRRQLRQPLPLPPAAALHSGEFVLPIGDFLAEVLLPSELVIRIGT